MFITTIENLSMKIKAINASYEKSGKEIKSKILISLLREYLEAIIATNTSPSMSLKILKKI